MKTQATKTKETERIKEVYKNRATSTEIIKISKNFLYSYFITCERELKYLEILKKHFGNDLSKINILEIGAGSGYNLSFFNRIGLIWENISANELLDNRLDILTKNFPLCKIYKGDALEIPETDRYDIVFQSTVFTSVLDGKVKQQLAKKAFELVKPGGFVLWYDFKYNNPKNKNVKGITKQEVKNLFGQSSKIEFYNTTLAPPIGRRIGKMYNLANFSFPFLRTHLIAIIHKPYNKI